MIQAQNLHYSYDAQKFVLKNVSIRISDGESIAILGHIGVGKTTLVKTFNGLCTPQKGAVFVDNVSTQTVNVAELAKKVGMAFQNPDHVLFNETVEDEILFSLRNQNLSSKDVDNYFEETVKIFKLEPLLDKIPFNLSGGERKLVSIASIYCWHPKHLILDEPTIGQDSYHKELLTRVVEEHLKSEDNVIIVNTHDVDWAISTFSRIIILKDGGILADGPPSRIFSKTRVIQESTLLPPHITTLVAACHQIWPEFPQYVIKEKEVQRLILDQLG